MEDFSNAYYEDMSTSLLASQPLTYEDKSDRRKLIEWDLTYSDLESSLSSDRNWRYSYWAHCQTLARFILPRRNHYLIVPNKTFRDNPINDSIIDSTATLAMQICASGMWTGLTSPSRPWFQIEPSITWQKIDSEISEWLEDTEKKVYTVLAQSNFYTVMAQCFQDVATFGTAPVIIYEDAEDVIRLYSPCSGEYFLRSGARLDIDTLTREYTLTVKQIVDQFGVENCPTVILELWSQGGGALNTEFVVAHTIAPNMPIRGKNDKEFRIVPEKFPYKEVHWLRGLKANKPLSRRGFESKPFMVARWSTVSNYPYGRSVGMDALGDIKQLQRETLRKTEFIDKLVNPPVCADLRLKNEPASSQPGAITYVDVTSGKPGMWPIYELNPSFLTPMVQDIEKVSARINKAFFVDVFMAITQMAGVQPRNERELSMRDLERLQQLGPFVELFEQEFAGPAIQRIIQILDKKRLLKPKPKSLQNVPLKISYISIMKIAQRDAQSVSTKDYLSFMGAMSSAAKAGGLPDPLRIINLDKTARKQAELVNFPQDCLFTDDEVAHHDQVKHEAVADQKNQQAAPQLAMAGVNAAKTLSQTPVPGGSALDMMLGGS